jgi:acyl-CoA thioesterase-1
VLLIGMEMPPNYGQQFAQQFRTVFSDLAKARHAPLVPFLLAGFAQRQELFQADGLHPTAAAQPLILDTIWPALATLLKE